jgi:hypothetical protein
MMEKKGHQGLRAQQYKPSGSGPRKPIMCRTKCPKEKYDDTNHRAVAKRDGRDGTNRRTRGRKLYYELI